MTLTLTTQLQNFPTGLLIGGRERRATGGQTFLVYDPATEEVLAEVADAQTDDWFFALEEADSAQYEWAAIPPRRRSEILTAIFKEIIARKEDLARLITLEMGKPLKEALGEVSYGAEYFRWFAEETVRIPGRYGAAPSGAGAITVSRRPIGPVLAITPWNFPLAMATRKIAPALAAGCPIIVKPASETPLTLLLLGKVMAEVLKRMEAPTGVISIVPTLAAAEMSAELMADPRLRKVTFTGSTPVGRKLVEQSAQNLVRTSMELGGNAPFIVAADADLALAIEGALAAKMRNGGEACIAANRFLVDKRVAAEFTERLTSKMEGYHMGHGLDEQTALGPIITEQQRQRIADLVDSAVDAGATVNTGGIIPEGPGYFYSPTVLTGVPADADIIREEIFGPVATVTEFDGLEEGVRIANDTEFGLAAYGYSASVDGAQYLADNLRAGMIGLNRATISDPAAPFGGIGQSGFGREGGTEGLEEYLETLYIAT